MTNTSEGTLIGISKFAPFIAHSVGDIDSFPIIGDCNIVAIHVVEPGLFKRSWFHGELKAGTVHGFQISEKLWRVVIVSDQGHVNGWLQETLNNVLARARKLDAIAYLQNGPQLRPVEQSLRTKAQELNSVIIMLNKPVNKASRATPA